MSITLIAVYNIFIVLWLVLQVQRTTATVVKLHALVINMYSILAIVAVMGACLFGNVAAPKLETYELIMFFVGAAIMLSIISGVTFKESSLLLVVAYRVIMLSSIAAHLFFVFPFFKLYIP